MHQLHLQHASLTHSLISRALDMMSSMTVECLTRVLFIICIARLMVAPRKKASAQQLASKFTILAPPLTSTLSVASAPVSPHMDRTIEALVSGISPGTPYESVSLPATPTATENRSTCLPENGFFLAVMSVYWSNLVGPRIEQVRQLLELLLRRTDVIRSSCLDKKFFILLTHINVVCLSLLMKCNGCTKFRSGPRELGVPTSRPLTNWLSRS